VKISLREIVRIGAALAACLGVVTAASAADPDAAVVHHTLSIPRQTLDVALKDLARQTGFQIVRFSDAVKGDVIVGPLNGAYSIEQALQALLAPSGLTYRSLNSRAYMVVTPQEASGQTGALKQGAAPADATAVAAESLRLARADEAMAPARPQTPSVAADENGGMSLEEVIVTAQKVEQRLRDVPMSITAMTVRELRALDATQFLDFANTVPSLSFTSSGVGQTQVSLRGVTSGYNVSPTVGIYVDDVPYGSSTPFVNGAQLALDVGLFDLSRIEILRGPQGALYGASTMGGLLKYVTNAPDAANVGGTARANISSTQSRGVGYDAASAINAPLADNAAALRVGGFYRRNDGYIDNLTLDDQGVDQAEIYGGRIDFMYAPSERLSVRLSAFAQDIARDGSIAADFDRLSGRPIDGPLEQRRTLAEPFGQRFRLASATVKYEFDAAALTSITGYQTARTRAITDYSALYVPQFGGADELSAIGLTRATDTDKLTHEVRLAKMGPKVDWLLGAFYTREDSGQFQQLLAYDPGGALSPRNFLTLEIPSGFEEAAGFGNLTFHLSGKLDVAAGLRYVHNSQRQEQVGSGEMIEAIEERSSSDSVATYLASVRYRPRAGLMTYFRFATGYRPGGPNAVVNDANGQPRAPTTFDSDELASYEVGVKFGGAGRRLSADLAVYYIDWDDMQILAIRNGLGVVANAAKARSEGAELTVSARPVSDLSIVGAFGYARAELTEDAPDLGGVNGESLPDTPELTAALSAEYRLRLGGHDAFAGAAVRYVADRSANFDQSMGMPQYELPAYTAVDVRGGITVGSARLQLYCRNVGDERGQLSAMTGTSPTGGPANVSILQPRTVGVSLDMNF
jgi:outer membrane receptor protein involved in Fe transport